MWECRWLSQLRPSPTRISVDENLSCVSRTVAVHSDQSACANNVHCVSGTRMIISRLITHRLEVSLGSVSSKRPSSSLTRCDPRDAQWHSSRRAISLGVEPVRARDCEVSTCACGGVSHAQIQKRLCDVSERCLSVSVVAVSSRRCGGGDGKEW
ncbi:hypothetical protein Tco_0277386 [Tanacetum coccineum]